MHRVAFALISVVSFTLVACSSDDAAPKPGALSACLARPGELPRPPSGALPCELLPPGLSLK